MSIRESKQTTTTTASTPGDVVDWTASPAEHFKRRKHKCQQQEQYWYNNTNNNRRNMMNIFRQLESAEQRKKITNNRDQESTQQSRRDCVLGTYLLPVQPQDLWYYSCDGESIWVWAPTRATNQCLRLPRIGYAPWAINLTGIGTMEVVLTCSATPTNTSSCILQHRFTYHHTTSTHIITNLLLRHSSTCQATLIIPTHHHIVLHTPTNLSPAQYTQTIIWTITLYFFTYISLAKKY